MLKITVNKDNVNVNGNGTTDEIITDATLSVLAVTRHLSEVLNISQDVAFARLYCAASAALTEYKCDVPENEGITITSMPFPDKEE